MSAQEEKVYKELLYNNPMVESAKKALTPEQQEEYKKIGEYMYNNKNLQIVETGSAIKESTQETLLAYAVEAIKAGGDPKDLSEPELRALCHFYGAKWYEKFGLEEDEIRQPSIQMISESEAGGNVRKISRQQKRLLERQTEKTKKKDQK